MWSYSRNQWSKHTNVVDLKFLSNYIMSILSPKTGTESC